MTLVADPTRAPDELRPQIDEAARRAGVSPDQWLRDLVARELAKPAKPGAARVTWENRLSQPELAAFRSTIERDWSTALKDVNLLGALLRDVLRAANAPVRRGQRALMDRDDGVRLLGQLFGEDYAVEPFPVAFLHLTRGVDLEDLEAIVDIPRDRCQRLLDGKARPTADELEQIAESYRKQPTFFVEYRIGIVLSVLGDYLTRVPEASVGLVRQFAGSP